MGSFLSSNRYLMFFSLISLTYSSKTIRMLMRRAYRLLHVSNKVGSQRNPLHSVHTEHKEKRWLGSKNRCSEEIRARGVTSDPPGTVLPDLVSQGVVQPVSDMWLRKNVPWMSGIRFQFDAQTTHDSLDVIGLVAI